MARAWVDLTYLSDHTPICFQLGKGKSGTSYPFKFNLAWMQETEFDHIVKKVWTNPSLSLPGDAQGNLVRKLKSLRTNTINWLKWKKTHETTTLNSLELKISCLHRLKTRSDQKNEIDANLHTLEATRLHILQAEEKRWRLKSCALWLSSGDSNTRFFHRFASHRRNKKLIWDIEVENGSTAHRLEDINKRHTITSRDFSKKIKTSPYRTRQMQLNSSHRWSLKRKREHWKPPALKRKFYR
jgi:hypothetical protein